jgi:hypothetical protein
MADPSLYTYPSPLKGYEGLQPLPTWVQFHDYTYPSHSACSN